MKRRLLTIFSLLALVLFVAPHFAHAGWFSVTDTVVGVVGDLMSVFTAIAAWIVKTLIIIAAAAIEFVLYLNGGNNIVNSPTVQVGFSVSLAIVNLGYVAALIVIAIATILRDSTYGAKQTLVRLLVSAVLVNFGLVIAGVMINFADQIMMFFLNQIKPQGGVFSANNGFSDKLAGALNINQLDFRSASSSIAQITGGSLSTLVTSLSAPLMTIAMGIIIFATLLAVAVMLFVRYIYLVFLLIIMPFSYIAWILPKSAAKGTGSYLTGWWNKFTQWLLFGPATLFFIYLALLIRFNQSDYLQTITAGVEQPGGAGDAVRKAAGGLQTGFVTTMMENLLLVGLLMGGLMVAKSMGMHGAGAAEGYVKSIGNSAKNKASTFAKNTATKTALTASQKLKVGNVSERMARLRIPTEQKSGFARGAMKIVSGAASLTGIPSGIRATGRAMQELESKTGKNMVGAAQKDLSGLSTDQSVNALKGLSSTGDMEKILAILGKLSKDGKLDKVEKVDGMSLVEFMRRNENVMKRYNQNDTIDAIKDKHGIGLVEAQEKYAKEFEKFNKDPKAEGAEESLRKAKEKLRGTYNRIKKETAEDLAVQFSANLDDLARKDPLKFTDKDIEGAFSKVKDSPEQLSKFGLEAGGDIKDKKTREKLMKMMYDNERKNFYLAMFGKLKVGDQEIGFKPETNNNIVNKLANEENITEVEDVILPSVAADIMKANGGEKDDFGPEHLGKVQRNWLDKNAGGMLLNVDKMSPKMAAYQKEKKEGKKKTRTRTPAAAGTASGNATPDGSGGTEAAPI